MRREGRESEEGGTGEWGGRDGRGRESGEGGKGE